MSGRADSWRQRIPSATLRSAGAWTARFLVAALCVAVVAAPLSFAWAISRTTVHETIGVTPATFTLNTSGHSEVRLGIAGTAYVPLSRGPIGVVATVNGPGDPGAGDGDLASYVTPEMLELYTGLFHDPERAVQGYVDLVVAEFRHMFLVTELIVAGVGGLVVLLLSSLFAWRREGTPRVKVLRSTLVVLLVLAVSATLSTVLLRTGAAGAGEGPGTYALPALDGTVAAGSTTDSPILRAVLGGVVPKVQSLVQRQEDQERDYAAVAASGLEAAATSMQGPRPGERAVLMQSDMHCNTTMIRLQSQVVSMLRDQFGEDVPALLAVTGDLTTNGTAAEGGCIADEAAIADGAPIAAVTGNHESEVSAAQMEEAGMTVLSGAVQELGGVRVLGDGDPARSELFGATRLRGEETQTDLGTRLREAAQDERPDLVLVHEAYAAQAFLGVDDMRAFLDARGSATIPQEDDIDDVPAAAVFYGHWHRSVEPRVVWNSDGSWTLVMELDTSGGAVASPTIGRFSTPWSRPLQEASFPVVFLDEESGLVTGYQVYSFAPDGVVTVLPRVDVGGTSLGP
ncbi:metallophosphoesterase family protein [Nocardioides sp.]|uniref:metallophosphoesterase family protein n=1 Tax=Nocardioides sp. TaxID=35761 RepID=UPI003D115580